LVGISKYQVWKEAVMYIEWIGDGSALEFEPAHRDFGQSDRTACWESKSEMKNA
jgi:hypothetical protein